MVKKRRYDLCFCGTRASYGHVKGKPLCCARHGKQRGMKDVMSNMCEICETVRANFAHDGEKPTRCKNHIETGMSNVNSKKCEKCKTTATFGFIGKGATRCKEHILKGMVDVISTKCQICSTLASFGYKGQGQATRCREHILKGMVDVKSKKCERKNCKRLASFGFDGTQPTRCRKHILKNMINLKGRCEIKGCNTSASFGYKGGRAIRCKTHIAEKMIKLKKLCHFCKLFSATSKYRGYCVSCFVKKFPDAKMTKNYKYKETALMELLKKEYPELNFQFDKMIGNNCPSKRRPDALLELNAEVNGRLTAYSIIIECDEFGHKYYDEDDEELRLEQLSKDLGEQHIVFLRFNPDKFKRNSCFKYTKNEPPILNEKEWNKRAQLLKDEIDYYLVNFPKEKVELVYIAFDSKNEIVCKECN